MRLLLLASLASLLLGAMAGAQTVAELVAKGDAFDKSFRAKEALAQYEQAEKLQPDNVSLLCRMARQYRHLLADASNNEEKVRLGRRSLDYALKAAALAPNDPEAQLSPAISYGKMLALLPTKEQVATSPKIKASVDKTLALDARNDLAWHILGRWNRVLAEVSGVKRALGGMLFGKLPTGSFADAEKCLLKAVAINPQRLMHHIELGRIYAQQGRKEDAKRLINKGLGMPNREKDDPDIKALGREALSKL